MHLGQVRLQFSWPPLFFARIAYIDRQFAERSYLEAPLNSHRAHSRFVPRRPCPSCFPPPATPRSCTRGADESTDPEPPNNTSANGGCCQSWSYGVGNNLVIQYVGAIRHSLTIRDCASQCSQVY